MDNWGRTNKKNFYIHFQIDVWPSFDPPNGSHAFGWNDLCLNQDIKRIMDAVRTKCKKKHREETYTKNGNKRALPKAYHVKMAEEVMTEIINDEDDVYHNKYRSWLTKTGFNWVLEDAEDDK